MKKLLTAILAACTALATFSCMEENPIEPQIQGEYLELTANLEAPTKTVLNPDFSVRWNQTDAISLSGGANSAKFTIKSMATDGSSARFEGTIPASDKYWALYPFQENLSWANGTVTAELPAVQQATEGSFTEGASLAVAEVVNNEMAFKNVGAILAFGIQDDGIRHIRLSSNDGTPLAGRAKIKVGQTPTVEVTGGVSTIDLKGKFVKGKTYYMAVLPGKHAQGFTLTFYKADGKAAELNATKALTLERNSNVRLFNMQVPTAKWKYSYKLVKDISTLKAGDVVCIGSSARNAVVSAFDTKNDALTAVANSATIVSEALQGGSVMEFTLGKDTNGWTFQGADKNYLGAADLTLSMSPNATIWTVAIADNGKADISSIADRYLLHAETNGGVVKNYKTSTKYAAVQLYRKVTLSDLDADPTPGTGTDPTPDPEPDPKPEEKIYVWRMVKDATSLKAGDVFKIGNVDNAKGASILSGEALSAQTATFTGEDMSCANAAEFTLGGTAGSWTLTSTEGTLTATSGKTALSYGGNTTWSISIDQNSGKATISAENGRCIYYDQKYSFKNYKKNSNIQIYRKTEVTGGQGGGGGEVTPPVEPDPDPNPNPNPDPNPDPTPGQPANGQIKWLEMPGTQFVNDPGMYCVSHHALLEGKQQRNYSILYDSNKYTSLWVAYPLCQTHMGNLDRGANWSQLDPDIPEDKQQKVNVTYETGYDRGHQLPDASRRGSVEMQEQTYYPTNMTPQNSSFNKGCWKSLEIAVRNSVPQSIGPSDTVYVTTGAAFQSRPGGNENVTTIAHKTTGASLPVPNYYWKVVLKVKRDANGNITDAKAAAFWLPHQDLKGHEYTEYETTVDQVEAWTGFDFFVNLPVELQKTAEAQKDWAGFSSF